MSKAIVLALCVFALCACGPPGPSIPEEIVLPNCYQIEKRWVDNEYNTQTYLEYSCPYPQVSPQCIVMFHSDYVDNDRRYDSSRMLKISECR